MKKMTLFIALMLAAPIVLAQGAGGPGAQAGDRGAATQQRGRGADAQSDRQSRQRADEVAEDAQERAAEREAEAAERAEEAQTGVSERGAEREMRNGEGRPQELPKGLQGRESHPAEGRGSETGQQKREEKSRGWWRFWD